MVDNLDNGSSMGAIAIIGMGGRFPGAGNMDEFWHNLYNGVESVKFFSREELIKMGIDGHLLDNPRFVAADAILEGMDQFDAAFFDYSAREAEIMDPQHRLFLESSWEVLESAGYNSEQYEGRISVFAGANLSGYMIRNLYSNPGLVENVGTFKIMIANGQDFLATKVSYKMNLTGPSVNVNTLCSSSMVAVHYACQNLLNYGCDLALAGGVSFQVSRNEAFFYQEGGIGSSDGHCRAFDSRANGTVSGSGLAVVVLKRLEDAIEDGDYIHAVIRGTGINNDGASKNSYTAPNVDGQAECVAEAIAMSGVDPETITYIDAHGTGTDLGDPIEIAALTKVFRACTKKKQFCAIGSVKTNIGHLVNAGGLASVVKTVLAMKHRVIPPSLNFEEPNPKIDFINSPFYVNTRLSKWETEGFPLRAGVSSFGIGGTNTHVVLEEAPEAVQSGPSKRPAQIICLSAKTGTALEKMTSNLMGFARKNPGTNIADAAYTLQLGRRNFNHRRFVLCRNAADLVDKLEKMPPESVFSDFRKPKDRPLVFVFAGTGAYVNRGRELYGSESAFRDSVNQCCGIYEALTGVKLREMLYPEKAGTETLGKKIDAGGTGGAALFAVQYALAQLFRSWGMEPRYMLGQGKGEYVAACLAGVLSLEAGLKLAAAGDESLPEVVAGINFNRGGIPFVSSVSGTWISDPEAESREYWLHQRGGERFAEGLEEVMGDPDRILIEAGPERDLGLEALLECIGKCWLEGGKIDWKKFYANERRHRIPLPTYPFERQRYWIEPGKNAGDAAGNEKLKKRPRPALETDYVPPRNEVEEIIIEKWQEVLGFDTIGVKDDFFELGGHSLIAAAVATELSKKFDVQIPMRTLFETTTAEGIARLIETYQWAAEGGREPTTGVELEDGTI